MCIIHVTVHEQQVTFQGHGHVIRLLSRTPRVVLHSKRALLSYYDTCSRHMVDRADLCFAC
jgi:hypothetical protein